MVCANAANTGNSRTQCLCTHYRKRTTQTAQSQRAAQILRSAGPCLFHHPNVSVCFPWYHLERQVLIEGHAEKISQAESLKYFMSRPRGSQIGAWVSEQSQVISSRALLSNKVKQLNPAVCTTVSNIYAKITHGKNPDWPLNHTQI